MFFLRIFLAATRVQTIVPTRLSPPATFTELVMERTTSTPAAMHQNFRAQPQFINLKELEYTDTKCFYLTYN